jgi:hypothetical protein
MNHELVVATTTYFGPYFHVKDVDYRRKLWQWFTESFAESDFAGHKVLLLIADDGSPEPPRMQRFPADVTFRYHFVHHGYNTNINENLNFAKDLAPLCLTVDSDAYFDPRWVRWLFSAIERYPDAAGWNLYNSPHHRCYAGNPEPGIIKKINTQNHGLCYRTADRPETGLDNWMEHYIAGLTKGGRTFVLPEVSMIQHTGCYGVNNAPKHSQDYDPLFPLNDRCGLAGYEDRSGFGQYFVDSEVKSGA